MSLPYQVMFRGKPACPCLAEWLPVYEAELLRRGAIRESIDIYQLIGGAAASAGTHSKGGAYDLAQVSPEAILVARQMGAAAWHRPKNWDHAGGIEHQHGVLNGCPHNGPARYQLAALAAGRNGLANNYPDTGPRIMPLPTWRQGIAWAWEQAKPQRPAGIQATIDAAKKAKDAAAKNPVRRRKLRDILATLRGMGGKK